MRNTLWMLLSMSAITHLGIPRHLASSSALFDRYFNDNSSLPLVFCCCNEYCDDSVRFQVLLSVIIGQIGSQSVVRGPYQKCMKNCATKLRICLAGLEPFDCYSDELRCLDKCTDEFGQGTKEGKRKKKRHPNSKCPRIVPT